MSNDHASILLGYNELSPLFAHESLPDIPRFRPFASAWLLSGAIRVSPPCSKLCKSVCPNLVMYTHAKLVDSISKNRAIKHVHSDIEVLSIAYQS
jgi:hypothetical protein